MQISRLMIRRAEVRAFPRVILLAEYGANTPFEQITTERIATFGKRLRDEGSLRDDRSEKVLTPLFGILERRKRRGWIALSAAHRSRGRN